VPGPESDTDIFKRQEVLEEAGVLHICVDRHVIAHKLC
jgi:hypothetical protein